jgi:hypothetical protein
MSCHSGPVPELTVAQVLKVFLPEYLDRQPLPAHHLKVLRRLAQCRSGHQRPLAHPRSQRPHPHLHRQGLRRCGPQQSPDSDRRRVHPPFVPAPAPPGLHQNPPLRPARQQSPPPARALARTALATSPLRFAPAPSPRPAPPPLTCPHCQGTQVRCIGRVDRSGQIRLFARPGLSGPAPAYTDTS